MTKRIGVPEFTGERRELSESDRAIIVSIRYETISCAETPFITYNLNYSGQCVNKCINCHSKSLWDTKDTDYKELGAVMDYITTLLNVGIVNGICILGTDNKDKEESVKVLIAYASASKTNSIVFTGYDIRTAINRYGYPNYYVCGKYKEGEWHENKKFYKLLQDNVEWFYAEISLIKYLKSQEDLNECKI